MYEDFDKVPDYYMEEMKDQIDAVTAEPTSEELEKELFSAVKSKKRD